MFDNVNKEFRNASRLVCSFVEIDFVVFCFISLIVLIAIVVVVVAVVAVLFGCSCLSVILVHFHFY